MIQFMENLLFCYYIITHLWLFQNFSYIFHILYCAIVGYTLLATYLLLMEFEVKLLGLRIFIIISFVNCLIFNYIFQRLD
jgi:hypothetical protein